MTLPQKRKIVEMFRQGNSLDKICVYLKTGKCICRNGGPIENIIRDFLNGKFTLKPRNKAK